jgi:hypothetical protein
MHLFVTQLSIKTQSNFAKTPRAVTPFGGLASFVGFLNHIGYAQKVQSHLRWQLTSPNAIPLAHTLTANRRRGPGARRFAHTELARADRPCTRRLRLELLGQGLL